MRSISRIMLLLGVFIGCALTGCDRPIRTMGPTEYGLKFRKLPEFLGGGLENSIIPSGQTVILFPWESLYRYNSSVREISWGPDSKFEEYLHTRTRDGNEVALAFTVRFQIVPELEKLLNTARFVATNDEGVQELVIAIARADIRNYMNELKTAEFIDPQARFRAINKVSDAMQGRLNFYGIRIVSVNLDDFRFERMLDDRKTDDTYQDRLDETQKLVQETEREVSRIDTVAAQKQQEYNDIQAKVNRIVEEAKGVLQQATAKGQSYLKVKDNEAKSILVKGKAEVEGMIEKINALSGSGGRALLKLDIARQLSHGSQSFIIMNNGNSSNDLSLNKTDTNQLLQQMGVVESMKEDKK